MSEEAEQQQPEDDVGDLVILAWLMQDAKKNHLTMGEVIIHAKRYFTGLENIKCVVPWADWPWNRDKPCCQLPKATEDLVVDSMVCLGSKTNHAVNYQKLPRI